MQQVIYVKDCKMVRMYIYIYIRVIQNNLMSLKGHSPEGILKQLFL